MASGYEKKWEDILLVISFKTLKYSKTVSQQGMFLDCVWDRMRMSQCDKGILESKKNSDHED